MTPSRALRNLRAAWAHKPWRRAVATAAISDAISFGLFFGFVFGPILQIGVDLLTALLLFLLLGRRWPLLIGLVCEAFPGLSAFPAWLAVVLALMVLEEPRSVEAS